MNLFLERDIYNTILHLAVKWKRKAHPRKKYRLCFIALVLAQLLSGWLLQKLQKIYFDQPGLIGEHWFSALWVHSEDCSNNSWNWLSSLGIQLNFCSPLCLAKFCDRFSVQPYLSQWVQQAMLVNWIYVYMLFFFPIFFPWTFHGNRCFRGDFSKTPCEMDSWLRNSPLCIQHLQQLCSWQIIRNVSWLISVISLPGCEHQTEHASSSDSAAYLIGRLSEAEQDPAFFLSCFWKEGYF